MTCEATLQTVLFVCSCGTCQLLVSSHNVNLVVGRSGKLLLALASTVILGSESRGAHDHISLSHDFGSRATLAMI
jgi:hypothetical protein